MKTFLWYELFFFLMNKILYCEDMPVYAEMRCTILKELLPAFELILTDSAEQGIEQIAQSIPDVKFVITDGQLLGPMKGWDLAEKLRTVGYTGPIIYHGDSRVPADKQGLFTELFFKGLATYSDLKEEFSDLFRRYKIP